MLREPLTRKPQPIRAPAPILRRKCARCGTPETPGGRCSGCERKIGLQRRLAIGAANDPAEREADRAADQALRGGARATVAASPPVLNRHASDSDGGSGEAPPSVHQVLAQLGRPLEVALRRDMEGRFGRDFSQVRVHDGPEAGRSTRDVGASAYTVGSDIAFAPGRYAPESGEGRRLVAHELAHVVQQGGKTSFGPVALQRQAAKGESKPKPEKKKSAANPCTRTILAEGSCQFLVDNSKYCCCDPDNGVYSAKRKKDIDGVACESQKFTPIFTCDNKCDKALENGCSDTDNWMALPGSDFSRSQCGDVWTICANGKATTGYVRDRSVTASRYEVSPGIQATLGVSGSFKGAVYKPAASQSKIDSDPCCKAP